MRAQVIFGLLIGACIALLCSTPQKAAPQTAGSQAAPRAVLDTYCVTCHNDKLKTAGLALDKEDVGKPSANPEVWEKVIGKLRAGSMPPPGRPRPDTATYRTMALWLENEIDRAWAANPNPGRIGAVHRLNRTEYNNAIRDLLDSSTSMSSRYCPATKRPTAASTTSPIPCPFRPRTWSATCPSRARSRGSPRACRRLKPKVDRSRSRCTSCRRTGRAKTCRSARGAASPSITTSRSTASTSSRSVLQRQYQDYLKGMGWPQRLDVRLDGKLLKRFTVGGEAKGRPAAASYAGDGEPGFAGDDSWEKYMQIGGDAGLEVRVPVEAGPHIVGVSFVREMWEPEGLPQPLQRGRVITNDQVYMDYANVGAVQIGGPYNPAGIAKDTPSRRAIFVCQPKSAVRRTKTHAPRRSFRAWPGWPIGGR